ncbi:MAG: SiaB family protein kinase [Bacteroidales bacterium]|nr:SiaB family protein kinase [Bacteroidales bacterium]
MQATISVLQFKGKLTFERIGILLNDLKNRKEAFDIQPILYKKLLTLMIEVLENVLKYSDHFEDFIAEKPDFLPEFELNRNDAGFILVSRNPVRIEDKDLISDKIDKINTSDEEELKRIYRETITNGMFTEKGGAGLGFIEMAKITTHDLEFSFHPAADKYSIFELILHINPIEQMNHG